MARRYIDRSRPLRRPGRGDDRPNPRTDRLVTIGAVGVHGGEILIEDSFEALLKIERNTAAVTVHGITRAESLSGLGGAAALEQFLSSLGDGVIVGHHVGH